jgi:hypothetical protein
MKKTNNIEAIVSIEKDGSELRVKYFMVGNIIDSEFTGILYGYEGGGDFGEVFVYKNKILPSGLEDLVPILSLRGFIEDVIPFNNEIGEHYPTSAFIKAFNISSSEESLITIRTNGFNIKPFDYCNVVWDNPIKHWNKDELKAHIKTEITRRIKE